MKYFSFKHKLHFLLVLEYALHFLTIFQVILKLILAFFNFQTYLLSAVLFLCFEFLRVFVQIYFSKVKQLTMLF